MKKNLPDRYFYPAVFIYEDGQEIAVDFPDLGVATSGTSEDDALLSARELLGCVMCGLEEDGEPIPAPSALSAIQPKENERGRAGRCLYAVRPARQRQSFGKPHRHSPGVAQCRRP